MKQAAAVRLNKYEVGFYFAAFGIGVFYSFYQLYLGCAYFDNYQDDYNDLTPGWSWIGRKQDVSDHEWSHFIPILKRLIPWVIGQLSIAQFFKFVKLNSAVICSWYIAVATAFLWNYFGPLGMMYLLVSPCITCLLTALRSKIIAYIVLLAILGAMEIPPWQKTVYEWIGLGHTEHYLLTIAFFWTQLRCISCTIDNIVEYKHVNLLGFMKHFVLSIAYCLYLPTLFLGPLILHSKFIEGVNQPFEKWNLERIRSLSLNLMRFVFWMFITQVGLHFLYCNALQYQPDVVANLNSWAFYGLGYCMGQYFCNKYIVIYGLGGEISRADDVKAPPPPKCIGRIHLYSDMWKHFDRGLYEFLLRYIYIPIMSFNIPLKKFVASFLTFTFIWIWHGVQQYIFIWSCLNFIGVTIEAIARSVGNSTRFINWQENYLSVRNIRRFNCAVAVPLLAMSAVSNFYFFAGENIGNIFFYRLFHDSSTTIVTLSAFLYCLCQISTEMKIIESQRIKDN